LPLQQTGKAWLDTYLNYITPIRFGVGGTDKGATKYRRSMNDQLTVFSSGVSLQCIKVDILERLYNNDLERFHSFHKNQTYILLELHTILLLLIIFIFDYFLLDL